MLKLKSACELKQIAWLRNNYAGSLFIVSCIKILYRIGKELYICVIDINDYMVCVEIKGWYMIGIIWML